VYISRKQCRLYKQNKLNGMEWNCHKYEIYKNKRVVQTIQFKLQYLIVSDYLYCSNDIVISELNRRVGHIEHS